MASKTYLLGKNATVKLDLVNGLSFTIKSTHYLPEVEKGRMITIVSPHFLVTNAEVVEAVNPLYVSPKMCKVRIKEGTFDLPYNDILGWEYADVTKFNNEEL